jgi:putative tryptophan/tyrosine transport system substrate-binding protein
MVGRARCLLSVLLVACFILFGLSGCHKRQPDKFVVAIVSIVEIEPIAQLREGFKTVFEQSGFAKQHKVVINEFNAQNDPSLQNQIVDKLATNKPNLIYVLGTPMAQTIQKRLPDVLLLQGAVTDPVAAGLAKSWEGSGNNYFATSDLPPVQKQLDLIVQLTPKVKNLGIIYNPGETNSVAVVSRIRSFIATSKIDMRLAERPVSNTAEVTTAIQSLLGKADAIYLPPDNTVHAAIPVVGKFANENNIPLYATVSTALKDGALATLSLDFKVLGEESAKLALKVLAGSDPGSLPIAVSENPAVTINGKIAAKYGIDLSPFTGRPNVRIVR